MSILTTAMLIIDEGKQKKKHKQKKQITLNIKPSIVYSFYFDD